MAALPDFIGLMPIIIGAETSADTMKRLATPIIGGLITSYFITLLIYPVIFYFYNSFEVRANIVGKLEHDG